MQGMEGIDSMKIKAVHDLRLVPYMNDTILSQFCFLAR